MAKIIKYANSQDMPQCLQLKEGDAIRFNGGKYWWTIIHLGSEVAYLRRRTRWGVEFRAITLEKQEKSRDLFGITYYWHMLAIVEQYKYINFTSYEHVEADVLLPQYHNIYSLEIKSKKLKQ